MFYFNRLQKRIFNHMPLSIMPKRTFDFLSCWSIHFWLVFYWKCLQLNDILYILLIWMILCFVLCTLHYFEIMHWQEWPDKINAIMYFPTFNCLFDIWVSNNVIVTQTCSSVLLLNLVHAVQPLDIEKCY